MNNKENVTEPLPPATGSVIKAEIKVIALPNATRDQVSKACHEAAYQHFGEEGAGTIHLTGLELRKVTTAAKTYLLHAELRIPPNEKGQP